MTLDASLSVLHWWTVLLLIAALIGEKVLTGGVADAHTVRRLAAHDLAYGLAALLVLAAGFARAALGAKGWAFYAGSPMFWTKIGLFALIGLMSVVPTIAFRRWRKSLGGQPGAVIEAGRVAQVRRWIDLELTLLALMPVAAAMMARGIGF